MAHRGSETTFLGLNQRQGPIGGQWVKKTLKMFLSGPQECSVPVPSAVPRPAGGKPLHICAQLEAAGLTPAGRWPGGKWAFAGTRPLIFHWEKSTGSQRQERKSELTDTDPGTLPDRYLEE